MIKDLNRNKLLASRLTEVMEKHGVTVDELAKALKSGALYVIGLIKGEINFDCLSCSDLCKICECCNCSADYLLGLSDSIN